MTKKHILITGAGQRIGYALACHFLAQGHQVTVSYRTPRPQVSELIERGAHCIQADFSTDAGIHAFIQAIDAHNPVFDCLIHNASSWDSEKQSQDFAALFDSMMQIHAKTPYLINMAATRWMNSGDIIHLTDYVAHKGSAKHLAYAASKAALENLTLSFAQQLAPDIKVNSISPALIMFNDGDDDAYREKARKKSILGTVPGEQEVINACDFILASQHMTGQSLKLDGGRHLA
ncbi:MULTISPECIES: dihydromonapterin reductase [unclassified Salinivibrio]|uniref:dihydromonapterin reductase n=1 Tax=unclassified Salinivibrio TaxID=2636825 RepID=UPI0009850C16|nr:MULTISPECIES: dihydromonapterin reductase [unclassified Salinivibrio]OOF12048.1 dihydromonapterin reductase [Salinivibrio sp. PR5]OOF22897.1 dihydromonapterin reductase [Salinivibrio sp. IB574]OOF25099.1 dihydromonapterin reductase [Salinivibrio sp. IB872]